MKNFKLIDIDSAAKSVRKCLEAYDKNVLFPLFKIKECISHRNIFSDDEYLKHKEIAYHMIENIILSDNKVSIKDKENIILDTIKVVSRANNKTIDKYTEKKEGHHWQDRYEVIKKDLKYSSSAIVLDVIKSSENRINELEYLSTRRIDFMTFKPSTINDIINKHNNTQMIDVEKLKSKINKKTNLNDKNKGLNFKNKNH